MASWLQIAQMIGTLTGYPQPARSSPLDLWYDGLGNGNSFKVLLLLRSSTAARIFQSCARVQAASHTEWW